MGKCGTRSLYEVPKLPRRAAFLRIFFRYTHTATRAIGNCYRDKIMHLSRNADCITRLGTGDLQFPLVGINPLTCNVLNCSRYQS